MEDHNNDRGTFGSWGEHVLQQRFATTERARTFYRRQVLDHINDRMQAFLERQEMLFVATASAAGACDCSFRAGVPGFVHVVDAHTIVYPEYRGNGVMASLGNLLENPGIGLLFIDFFADIIGLHVNGTAQVLDDDEVLARDIPPALRHAVAAVGRPSSERWVWVDVEEAYVHCSKHIPWLQKRDKRIYWGTDDARQKGGDYFGAARQRSG